MLQQAVHLRDGGEGLAGPGRHLDESARLVGLQRNFKIGDRPELALAQAGGVQRRERGDA